MKLKEVGMNGYIKCPKCKEFGLKDFRFVGEGMLEQLGYEFYCQNCKRSFVEDKK